jgi:hypothetical protein
MFAGAHEKCSMDAFDMASLFISSGAHDIDHPGNNNVFEVKTKSKLATLYNDQSVLESHHAASLFFLVEDEECNIFKHFQAADLIKMRKQIVENILFTDMTKH